MVAPFSGDLFPLEVDLEITFFMISRAGALKSSFSLRLTFSFLPPKRGFGALNC